MVKFEKADNKEDVTICQKTLKIKTLDLACRLVHVSHLPTDSLLQFKCYLVNMKSTLEMSIKLKYMYIYI